MQKILTIAISAYNKEKYLYRCVKSLICQSIHEIEIIIINDGSTDETSKIAHELEKDYPQSIIVVDKQNGHQGSCINKAIELAGGKYFKMLDADDYFSTDVLEYCIHKLRNINVDMVITGHVINSSSPVSISPININENIIYDQINTNFSELGMFGCIGMHGVAFKTDILKENHIHLSEHCSFSDAEYCYYPLKYCKTILFISKDLYIYETGIEGQESSIKTIKTKDDAYHICQRMINDYIQYTNETPHVIKQNSEIILLRCFSEYLSLCLLHFKIDKAEKIRINKLLSLCKKYCPNVLNQLLRTHTRKIPFVKIYKHTGKSSYFLFHILNRLYRYIK